MRAEEPALTDPRLEPLELIFGELLMDDGEELELVDWRLVGIW